MDRNEPEVDLEWTGSGLGVVLEWTGIGLGLIWEWGLGKAHEI